MHVLIDTAVGAGIGAAAGAAIAVTRILLDFIGWWPMKYPPGG